VALLMMDSFDCYADAAEWETGGWGIEHSDVDFSTTLGKDGGGCILISSSAEALADHALTYFDAYSEADQAGNTYIFQGWVYIDTFSGSTTGLLCQIMQGLDEIIDVRLSFDGKLQVSTYDLQVPTAATQTAGGQLTVDTWHFIELKVVMSSVLATADGSFDLRVDGNSVSSGSSLEIGNDRDSTGTGIMGANRIRVGNAHQTLVRWDDVVAMDGTGADANLNAFTGPRYIEVLNVAADGGTVDWTRNTGSNDWEMVDDTANANDGDTTYVSSNTVAEEGRYNLAAPSNTDDEVHAVQIRGCIRKDDAGARTIRGVMNVAAGTEEITFATIGVTTEYQWLELGVRETNDTGGTAWDANELTNIEIGVEIVS